MNEQEQLSRRDFLKFIGVNFALLGFSLSGSNRVLENMDTSFSFKAIAPSSKDELVLAEGFSYKIIRSWGDEINQSEKFGTNNDYIAFFELEENKALLWVNHEEPDPRLIPEVGEQAKAVGGSVIVIEKLDGEWQFSNDKKLQEKYNRRYDANTVINFTGPAQERLISCKGTLANCSGGITPWNTVLSCEENFEHFPERYGWQNFPLKEYGWVVEVDPYDRDFEPLKHTALGRFAHESASVTLSGDNRVVIYMGDDKEDEHLYKYVSDESYQGDKNSSHLLSEGKLYVAKLDEASETGRWELLSLENPKLLGRFVDEAHLKIETREAAKYLDATQMNRPEDIEISPYDKSVFVAMTNNVYKEDNHGSIFKINESNNDHASLSFSYEIFVKAGPELGLSCPDNLAFDDKGNLWVATDISGLYLNKDPYEFHANNSLFMIPLSGKEAGVPKRFASAPIGAEITGISFSKDFKTLFFSVQHPGEYDESHWPSGSGVPRSSVLAVNLV